MLILDYTVGDDAMQMTCDFCIDHANIQMHAHFALVRYQCDPSFFCFHLLRHHHVVLDSQLAPTAFRASSTD
jgi:hypothetical protein